MHLEHGSYIGNNDPNWTFIFFRGVGIPPTTVVMNGNLKDYSWLVMIFNWAFCQRCSSLCSEHVLDFKWLRLGLWEDLQNTFFFRVTKTWIPLPFPLHVAIGLCLQSVRIRLGNSLLVFVAYWPLKSTLPLFFVPFSKRRHPERRKHNLSKLVLKSGNPNSQLILIIFPIDVSDNFVWNWKYVL